MTVEPNNASNPRRETFLTIILTGIAAVAILLFLVLVTGGIFLYVGLIVMAIAVVGYLHYLMWGQAMDTEVQSEALDENDDPPVVHQSPGRWGNGKLNGHA